MDPYAASTSATERLAVFRARQQQHSPIKTRSRARKVLAERPTGNARASGTAGKVKEGRKLVKTTSDPGPSALTFPRASPSHFSIPPRDVLAPPLSPYKPGSPNKRPRSPDDENGQASPAKRLHASPGKPTLPSPSPIRSPPRHVQKLSFPTAFALSPPAMALPSDLEDPFSASPSPPTSDGKDRPLLLRTRSIEKDLPLMTAIVAANQPQIRIIDSPTPVLGLAPYPANSPSIPTFSLPAQVSPSPLSWSTIPSQSLLSPSQVSTPTPSFAIQASSVGPSLLAPAAEIVTRSSSSFKPRTSAPAMMQGGHAAFLASLSGEEISPRRGLQRSKSTSSLGDERIDPSLLLLTRPPSPAPPSPQHAAAPTPVVERKLPGFGSPQLSPILLGVPSPSRISTSHLSPTPLRRSPLSPAVQAVAARPSGIPRLAIIAATPARASPYAASPGPSPGPLTLRVPAEPDEDGASPVEKAAPPSTATAGMSSDMANRLAGLQSMMSSMGPSRRRSTGTNAPAVPPKTPLTGGHALRRRVSASAVPSPVPQVKRVPSNGAMRKVVSTNCAAEVMGSEGGAAALAATIAQPLRDVVAFVDVRTAEGDDASEVFVEMLRSLGARVSSTTP